MTHFDFGFRSPDKRNPTNERVQNIRTEDCKEMTRGTNLMQQL